MGVVPGWAGATHLVHKVGRSKALDLLLSGRRVNAKQALQLGLIDDIISSNERTTPNSNNEITPNIDKEKATLNSNNEKPAPNNNTGRTTPTPYEKTTPTGNEKKTTPIGDAELLEAGVDYIQRRLGHLPPQVIHAMKSAVVGANSLSYDASVGNERNNFKQLWGAEANLLALRRAVRQRN
mgnify:FL=1